MDGFDHYYLTNDVGFTGGAAATGQKWDTVSGGQMHPKFSSGRFGSGTLSMAMQLTATLGQSYIQKLVTTERDEMIVGLAFLPKTGRADLTRVHFRLDDGTNVKMELNMATNIVTVVVNDVTTVATSAVVLVAGSWQYMEFRVKIHSTLGEVEVRRGEAVIISTTGLNTGTTGVLVSSLRVECNNNAQGDLMDDLYLLDTTGATNNDFLGEVRVDLLEPKAAGGNEDFTLFTDGQASYDVDFNWQAVKNSGDITIGRDHNYVESGLVGARDDYTMKTLSDVGVTPITIQGVQVVNNTKKTATGVIRFRDEMTIADTQYDNGADVTATTGDYTMSTFIRDTDPSDGLAWTEGKVAAVGSGFTITFKET